MDLILKFNKLIFFFNNLPVLCWINLLFWLLMLLLLFKFDDNSRWFKNWFGLFVLVSILSFVNNVGRSVNVWYGRVEPDCCSIKPFSRLLIDDNEEDEEEIGNDEEEEEDEEETDEDTKKEDDEVDGEEMDVDDEEDEGGDEGDEEVDEEDDVEK